MFASAGAPLRTVFCGIRGTFGAKNMSEAMSDPLAKIKQKLLDEIESLSHELNVELPKEIAVARAHGDLSENAEYKYAKERQGYVNARMGQLKKRLGDLGMLNLTNIPKDRSGYGSRIVVLDESIGDHLDAGRLDAVVVPVVHLIPVDAGDDGARRNRCARPKPRRRIHDPQGGRRPHPAPEHAADHGVLGPIQRRIAPAALSMSRPIVAFS